jgi:hypothetical protein
MGQNIGSTDYRSNSTCASNWFSEGDEKKKEEETRIVILVV